MTGHVISTFQPPWGDAPCELNSFIILIIIMDMFLWVMSLYLMWMFVLNHFLLNMRYETLASSLFEM